MLSHLLLGDGIWTRLKVRMAFSDVSSLLSLLSVFHNPSPHVLPPPSGAPPGSLQKVLLHLGAMVRLLHSF